MSIKPVTIDQFKQVREIANKMNPPIGSKIFQEKVLDDGTIKRVMCARRDGLPITIGTSLVPPPGAQIRTLVVRVRLDSSLEKAAKISGHDVSDGYNWKEMDNIYKPIKKGFVEEELVLLNYPNSDGSWDKALRWAKDSNLRHTDPRHVFVINKQNPTFCRDTDYSSPMFIVATNSCLYFALSRAWYVRWGISKSSINLAMLSDFGSKEDWFVFRR